jgi:hypothetical protein
MTDAEVTKIRSLLGRYSGGDLSAIEELIAPEFFTYAPGADEPTATEIFTGFAADLRAAAPDLAIDIPDLAPGDDGRLHGSAVITGTHSGPLFGVAPTGRDFRVEIPVTLRAADGRYAVNAELAPPDAVAILRSIGLVPPADQMHLPLKEPVVVPDFLLKVLFTGQVAAKPCPHLAAARVTQPTTDRCDDCGPDDIWPALRMCLTCGHVGCCDTSTNKHAKLHWEQSGHPLMRSIRMDEGWIWCYEDSAFFQRRTLESIEARLAGNA